MKIHELMSICAEIVAKNPEAEVFILDREYFTNNPAIVINDDDSPLDLVLDYVVIK